MASENTSQIYLSLVVPCYNEEASLPLFHDEASKALSRLKTENPCEFIFIDDGSKDGTMDVLRGLAAQDSRIRYISFSRNFGKEAAMLAGLQTAKGEYTAVLDADLQNPPERIPQMLEAVASGECDCAGGRRKDRKGEPPIRSFLARRFYALMNKITDIEMIDGASDFRLFNRKYREALTSLAERGRFSKGIFPWVGFKTKWFEYENIERKVGTTKWSFWKLFLYSIDGITAFSSKPLAMASLLGVLLFLGSLVYIGIVVVRRIVWGDPVAGWASTMCIILFSSGIQLFTIGILGQYVAKIYAEVKKRPHYIVREEK